MKERRTGGVGALEALERDLAVTAVSLRNLEFTKLGAAREHRAQPIV